MFSSFHIGSSPVIHFLMVSEFVSKSAFSEYLDETRRGIRCRIRDAREPGLFPGMIIPCPEGARMSGS
jgi:hypothetical protein